MAVVLVMAQGPLTAQSVDERIRKLEDQLAQLTEQIRELKQGDKEISSESKQEKPRARPGDIRVYWKDGLRLDSNNGRFKLRIGGRIHSDFGFFSADKSLTDKVGVIRDGHELRRARFFVSGAIGRVDYKAEYDFGGGDADWKDVFIGLNKLPGLGKLKVGHFKEPFGLEELTSSNNVTFMERAITAPFVPSRNTGIAFQNGAASGQVTYALGVFRDSRDYGHSIGDAGVSVTGRITGTPVNEDAGRRLLHLGAAFSHQGVPTDAIRFRSRPPAHLMPQFVDTGQFPSRSYNLVGLEAASVSGPFSLQTEYVKANTDADAAGDPTFQSFYVQGSFFPTGEYRRYKASSGAFDRVNPSSSLADGGPGAIEFAARYSWMDLNDNVGHSVSTLWLGASEGGEMKSITLGVNWYVNNNARVMWNYLHSTVENVGDADGLQMRVHIDF
jgi:phosphate-selective porin OprO/OprP